LLEIAHTEGGLVSILAKRDKMASFITYDVSSQQSTVKQGMLNCGYQDRFLHENITYYLPNTTLWHPTADKQKAVQDLQFVTRTLGVVLQRAFAVPLFDGFEGIPGEPHK